MLAVERRGEATRFLQNLRCLIQCLLVGYSAGSGDLRNAAVDEEDFVGVSRWSYSQCAEMISRAIKATDAAKRSGDQAGGRACNLMDLETSCVSLGHAKFGARIMEGRVALSNHFGVWRRVMFFVGALVSMAPMHQLCSPESG